MVRLLAVLSVLLTVAFAQNLLGLAPQGAVAGFYVNDLRSSPYFKGVAQDWKQSGMEAFLSKQLRSQVGSDADLVGLFSGGLAVALYKEGFMLVARPDAKALQALRKDSKGLKNQNGWLVGTDQGMTTGFSKDLIFIATPQYAKQFLAGKRGLKAPVSGDIALWGAPPQDLIKSLKLPPRSSGAAQALQSLSFTVKLTPAGYTDETRVLVNPNPDPALASFFLPKGQTGLDVSGLPQGYSVSNGVLDLGRFATYLSGILREFDIRMNLDLRAFGSRYATVTVAGPPAALDGRGDNMLGHSLIYWELKDPAAAEESFKNLLSQLADFGSPQGQGGLKELPNEGDFKAVELGLGATLYYKVENNLMVVATSKAALQAVGGKTWAEHADFQRFKAKIPTNATGFTYGDQRSALKESVGQLGDTLPQTIGTQMDARSSKEFAQALSKFMNRLADRFGSMYSYTTTENNTLVSRGYYEVKW